MILLDGCFYPNGAISRAESLLVLAGSAFLLVQDVSMFLLDLAASKFLLVAEWSAQGLLARETDVTFSNSLES